MNNEQFVNRINVECRKKKLLKKDLYAFCEVSNSYLSDILKKGTKPSVESVEKISSFLNCSIDYLLGRTDVPTLQNKDDIDLFNMIQTLPLSKRSEVVVLINKLKQQEFETV